MSDPFRHHPGLRGLITEPEASFFRDFSVERFTSMLTERGLPIPDLPSDATREAGRRAFLKDHQGDLWLFAYGSLMWDPSVIFSEIRRARLDDYERRFILKDVWGARGDNDRPGLMVALDHRPDGKGCDGLLFRISADLVEDETARVWRRERLGPAYVETWVTAETEAGPIQAATFVADHSSELIDGDLCFEGQVEYAATGSGFLGSSLDYVRGIAAQFRALKIDDPDVTRLLAAAEAYVPD